MTQYLPYLAPILGIGIWFAVVWIIGTVSGWRRLGRTLPKPLDITGEKFTSWQSLGFGLFTGYNNCVTFGISERGISICVMFLFRFGHPAILIPWDDLVFEKVKRFGFFPMVRINIVSLPRLALFIRPATAEKIAKAAGDYWPGYQSV